MKKLNLRKEDGSLNWKFILIGSSWKKFLLATLWTIAVLLMAYGYTKDAEYCRELEKNPCEHVSEISRVVEMCIIDESNDPRISEINFSELNLTIVEDETKKGENPSAS